jgi:hypothetical protein
VQGPRGCSNWSHVRNTCLSRAEIGTLRNVISRGRSRLFSRIVITPASKSSTRERRIPERRAPVYAATQKVKSTHGRPPQSPTYARNSCTGPSVKNRLPHRSLVFETESRPHRRPPGTDRCLPILVGALGFPVSRRAGTVSTCFSTQGEFCHACRNSSEWIQRRFSRTLNLLNPHPNFSADRPVFPGFLTI